MVRASLALLRPVFAALQPAPPLLRSAPASLRPAITLLRLAITLLRPASGLLRPPARTWRHDSSLRPPVRFQGPTEATLEQSRFDDRCRAGALRERGAQGAGVHRHARGAV